VLSERLVLPLMDLSMFISFSAQTSDGLGPSTYVTADVYRGGVFSYLTSRAVESEVPSSDSGQFRLSDSGLQLY